MRFINILGTLQKIPFWQAELLEGIFYDWPMDTRWGENMAGLEYNGRISAAEPITLVPELSVL